MSTLSKTHTEKPISLFIDNILQIYVISGILFSFCTPVSLLQIARTCRIAKDAVAAYVSLAFDINRHLSRYFLDPIAFRSLQARTGTLISGSSALQFFDRSFYPSSDLDLYVHMRHRREVGRWLRSVGYSFVPSPHQHSDFEFVVVHSISQSPGGIYTMPGIAAVFTFTKPARDSSRLKVQLIIAKNTPMEVVLGFHSTCVMNVISYEKAYCLFAKATLEDRRSLLSSSCHGRSKWRAEGLIKYSQRGFEMVTRLNPTCPSFQLGWRWIDDNISWVLPLDTFRVTPPPAANPSSLPVAHDPVAVCNWQLLYTCSKGAVMHFGISATEVLRYRYLVTDANLVNYLTRVLSEKMREEERKKQSEIEDWTYYDEELPGLCRNFLQDLGMRQMACIRR